MLVSWKNGNYQLPLWQKNTTDTLSLYSSYSLNESSIPLIPGNTYFVILQPVTFLLQIVCKAFFPQH